MRKSNQPLRLRSSLLEEVRRLAEQEGVTIDQLVDVAVAEKLSAMRTEAYFRERVARADLDEARRILARAGEGKAPARGDRLR